MRILSCRILWNAHFLHNVKKIPYLLFFSFMVQGCTSTVTVPDSQLMRQPLASAYELNVPFPDVWQVSQQVLKANGWKTRALSVDMGLLSLYRQKSGITSWITLMITPSLKGTTIHFHSINTLRPEPAEYPEMSKTTVFISLQSWEHLIEQISNATDSTVVNKW